jgi:hypothetical protein
MFPLGIFVLWMVINKLTLGWFLWPFNLSFFDGREAVCCKNTFIKILTMVLKEYFLWFVFGVLLVGLLFSIFKPSFKSKFLRREVVFFFILFSYYVMFFYLGPSDPRYFLFVYPLVFLGFANLLNLVRTVKKSILEFVVLVVCCGFILASFYNNFLSSEKPAYGGGRDFLFLMREVNTSKQVVSFIEDNFPNARIISYFPLDGYLKYPYLGYVDEPYKTFRSFECDNKPLEFWLGKDQDLIWVTKSTNSSSCKGIGQFILRKAFNVSSDERIRVYQLNGG